MPIGPRTASRTPTNEAGRAVAPLAGNPVLQGIARVGYLLTGLIYLLIGVTAIRMALSAGGRDQADQAGAARLIEAVPGGIIVLWCAAIAFVALAAWTAIEGFVGSAAYDDRGDRIRYLGRHLSRAIAHAALAVTTLTVLLGTSRSSDDTAQGASEGLLSSGAGALLLGAVGLAVIGIALGVVGIRRSFEKELDLSEAGRYRDAVIWASVVGYLARGLAFALLGVTLVVAAVEHDASKAAGLSGALESALGAPLGQPALVVIGAGLIVGGLATALRAKFQRMR